MKSQANEVYSGSKAGKYINQKVVPQVSLGLLSPYSERFAYVLVRNFDYHYLLKLDITKIGILERCLCVTHFSR